MYNLMIDPKILDKWMPVIEGQDKWKEFVSACPKVKRQDFGAMAQLFENIEKLSEKTVSADGTGNYSPILIPMLRRVMPALIGPQIFGTQPMSSPSGLVFVLRAVFQNDSVNSIDRSNSVILTVASITGAVVGENCAQTTDNSGANPTETATGTVRHIDGNNVLVEVLSGTFTVSTGATDVIGWNTLTIAQDAGDTTIAAVYENEALYKIIMPSYTGTYTTAAGEAKSTDIKEMGFKVDSSTITAKTRKLKAKWSEELEQDIKAIHNIDAESLLSSVAADEIIMEMNREMINLIVTKATNTSAYDFDTADGRWEMEKYQNLAAALGRAKRTIADQTRRGQGTFMIVSSAILNVLESSGRLKDTNVDPVQNVYAGKALGMDVFVDIWAANDTVYVGYKGGTEMDAGIFYSPYIPLQIRKGFGEEDGQPRAFFSTRYGLSDNPFGASNYYHAVTVANLPA
jgi:hypothetical protein